MVLNSLPIELLSRILQMCDSPRDLLSMIIASRQCRAAYTGAPSLFLVAVLQNAIEPEAMPHALVALHALETISSQPQDLASFMEKYFGPYSFELPVDMRGLTSLCRLYNRVSFFINDYSSRAMKALVAGFSREEILVLSMTERARLQRAFFRFEACCLVFPAVDALEDGQDHSPFARFKFSRYLKHLDIWEVEEMSCVHFYFMTLVGEVINHVEDQLVEAGRSSAITSGSLDESSVNLPYYGYYDSTELMTGSGDNDMTDFKALHLTNLSLFSYEARWRADNIVSYLATLGLSFMNQLVLADDGERRDMVRTFDTEMRDFFAQAVDTVRVSGATRGIILLHDPYHNAPSNGNLGYHLFKGSHLNRYLPIMNDPSYYPLRDRAFVFWDSERISQPQVSLSLREAASMLPVPRMECYGRFPRKSVEERLSGARIPRAEMHRLQREFGSLDAQGNFYQRVSGLDATPHWR